MQKSLLFLAVIAFTTLNAQVSIVKDINPGPIDGVSDQFISYNNKILFSANDAINGFELWMSDGSNANTQLVNDIFIGANGSNPTDFHVRAADNKVYFTATSQFSSSTNPRKRLLTTQGTTNTLTDISTSPNTDSFAYDYLEVNNNYMLAVVNHPVTTTATAFFFPATTGTQYLDVFSNLGITELSDGIFYNGSAFYRSITTNFGTELCKSTIPTSGPPINEVIDINSGSSSSFPGDMTEFNGLLYFSANSASGRELWRTDGTQAGTQMIIDLYPGTTGSNPTNLTVYNNALYFTANNPSLGIEIFKMNLAENVTSLRNINPGSANSSPFGLTVYNGNLYFAADDGTNGVELWQSGGFPSNTILLKNINTTNESTPQGFVEYFGELYFNADDGVNGRELWKTDGTNAGTVLVSDINTGALDSDPLNLTVAGDNLFFSATTSATGRELFRYIEPSLSNVDVEIQNFTIYPNPTSKYFSVDTNQTINNILVYDIQGKMIKSFSESKDIYNIEDLTNGLYFVRIKSNKSEYVVKLLKK
ncbi:ELWxxDGT repeat protein [Psychroserpens luteolus]|uniref:ELWxxDGT repeat protein n=1 Tax=Psychroserpens luteolus TaxID=2855840 RepID=UPI001E29B639|nr:ELWxxDGT repeat protein [Psychroserpens luteolus]MCD2259228.1 T9SS type A sorting domain-containing protein [Psychroserpens luteolus]